MSRTASGLVAAALLTVVAAGPPIAARQTPDRSRAPRPGPAPVFTPPPVVKLALSNGLPVWIVEMHEVPVAQVSLVIRAGSGADPAGRFGVASLTADMLDDFGSELKRMQNEAEEVGTDGAGEGLGANSEDDSGKSTDGNNGGATGGGARPLE